MEDIANKYLAVCNYQFGDFMHVQNIPHCLFIVPYKLRSSLNQKNKKTVCIFILFLIRRSRSTHFHLKNSFYVFFKKKTFYKRSFSAFGRKVYVYVLIKFQIRMCYYHGAHPHQHCNVQTKRHRTPSSKIVTSKHNAIETFFHVFFFKISQFFLSYKGSYGDF